MTGPNLLGFNRGGVTIGEITSGEAAKNATVDIPPYPGATPTERGSAISVGGQHGIGSQEYLTVDPVEKVVTFYKDQLSSKASIVQAQGNAEFTLVTENGISTVTAKHDENADRHCAHGEEVRYRLQVAGDSAGHQISTTQTLREN